MGTRSPAPAPPPPGVGSAVRRRIRDGPQPAGGDGERRGSGLGRSLGSACRLLVASGPSGRTRRFGPRRRAPRMTPARAVLPVPRAPSPGAPHRKAPQTRLFSTNTLMTESGQKNPGYLDPYPSTRAAVPAKSGGKSCRISGAEPKFFQAGASGSARAWSRLVPKERPSICFMHLGMLRSRNGPCPAGSRCQIRFCDLFPLHSGAILALSTPMPFLSKSKRLMLSLELAKTPPKPAIAR